MLTMPRTCLACSNPNRTAIDVAIASGEPLREIAEKSRISISALHRHKTHAGQAIVTARDRREQKVGDSALDEIERIRQHAWELVSKLEQDGDLRGGVVALREVRESLETQAKLLALANKAVETGAGGFEIKLTLINIGEAPVDEWEELPASYAALLPGKPKGKLYIVRQPEKETLP